MKKALRIIAIILTIMFALSLIAGCSNDSDNESVGQANGTAVSPITDIGEDGYLFIPEFNRIQGEIIPTSFVYSDDRIYFSSRFILDDITSFDKIYRVDLDGTNLTELTGYAPEFPELATHGSISVPAVHVTEDGNIWIAETGHFVRIDIPDGFDGLIWELYDYWEDLGSYAKLRKLDDTGVEIRYIDLSDRLGDDYTIISFEIDVEGNFYVNAWLHGRSTIYVLNDNGDVLFSLDTFGWTALIPMEDGTIAFAGQPGAGSALSLTKIDLTEQAWGESVQLPFGTFAVYPAAGALDVLTSDGSSLFGFDVESGEAVELLNWIDSDIDTHNVRFVMMLADGRILCIENTILPEGNRTEIAIFTIMHYTEIAERDVLTLATFQPAQNLQMAVRSFNRSSHTYRIQIIDYFDPALGDFYAGLERLSLEIMTGNIPDILDVVGLPLEVFVARGLLVDLYELIDSDPELERSDFVQEALRAAEIRGGLYQAFPMFRINTIVGNPAILGADTGWNIDELIAVLEANPQADRPMGFIMTNEYFMRTMLTHYIDEFIDWSAGTTHFYRDDFVRLLEFTDTLPAQSHFGGEWGYELIASGRQIMSIPNVSGLRCFTDLQKYRAMYGGELVLKGFPSESGNGNALIVDSGLAITTGSVSRDGAWEFLRMFLTEDWQLENTWAREGFLTNRAAFDTRLANEMAERNHPHLFSMGNFELEILPTTREDADQVMALIASMSGTSGMDINLMNIIIESAGDFWEGRNSAQDAARIIQSRASILVAEQG